MDDAGTADAADAVNPDLEGPLRASSVSYYVWRGSTIDRLERVRTWFCVVAKRPPGR